MKHRILAFVAVAAALGAFYGLGGYDRYDYSTDPTNVDLQVMVDDASWTLYVSMLGQDGEAKACDCTLRVEARNTDDTTWTLLASKRVDTDAWPNRTWTTLIEEPSLCGDLFFRATGEHHRFFFRDRSFTSQQAVHVPC